MTQSGQYGNTRAGGICFHDQHRVWRYGARTYDLTVTATGDATVIIVPATTISIDAAGIYTVIMRDPDPAVVGDTTGFILTDDFTAP
jgi:hypothetical protein